MSHTIELDPSHISLDIIKKILSTKELTITISDKSKDNIKKAYDYIQQKVNEWTQIYGVNTWFGAFSDKVINKEEAWQLQENLLLSHACWVGDPFDINIVKIAMILRIQNFIHGHSGVSQWLVDRLLFMLNNNIIPVVPSKWSVWSSGDLAPLSHIGITLLWEWEVYYQWKRYSTSKIFDLLNLQPLTLTYKEWLAFNNGTTFILANAIVALIESRKILLASNAIAALTIEASAGRWSAFDSKIHMVRPHDNQINVAHYIRNFLNNSQLFDIPCDRIKWKKNATQDSYSLRCIPQVHWASLHAYNHILKVIETEMNSVTDNPLIFVDEDEVLSWWNFHGQPLALVMDYLKIVMSELWNISERRTAKLIDAHHNDWLTSFLVLGKEWLNSWLMIPQYTAAALVSENKVLSHPASVDSIPTSANIEDHVSMGSIAARQAVEVVDNVLRVLAIEYMTAAQWIDGRMRQLGKITLWDGTSMMFKKIRELIPVLENDRYLAPDIDTITWLLQSEKFINELDVDNILDL